MRLGNSCSGWLRPLLLCGAGILISGCSHAVELKTEFGAWGFIDLKSGASASLRQTDARLIIFEEANSVSFCSASSSLYCFSSKIVEFAVPKERKHQMQWVLDDRVYCVIQRFPYRENSDGSTEQAWLIFSRIGKDCEGSKPYDVTAVFSEETGLRLISRTFKEGGVVELLSTDRIGFGAKPSPSPSSR